ncbi:MAG: hypothetical protein R3F59_28265 [Myxococcota bacterium]
MPVEDLDLAAPPDPDVAGLDVAVDEPQRLAVGAGVAPGGVERLGYRAGDLDVQHRMGSEPTQRRGPAPRRAR